MTPRETIELLDVSYEATKPKARRNAAVKASLQNKNDFSS